MTDAAMNEVEATFIKEIRAIEKTGYLDDQGVTMPTTILCFLSLTAEDNPNDTSDFSYSRGTECVFLT